MTAASPASPLLEVHGLSATIGGKVLFERLELQLLGGERLALVGPSGSGKTTLLKAFAGLVPFASGTVGLQGKTLPQHRARVAYVAQRPLAGDGLVEDELRWPFSLAVTRAASLRWQPQRATALLGALLPGGPGDGEAILARPARVLSGGELHLVAIVRALLLEPQVLLLDEPTAALDGSSRGRLIELLADWCPPSGNRALVFASHDAELVERLGSRRLRLGAPEVGPGEPPR